jgi:sensor histidine kinase YesM
MQVQDQHTAENPEVRERSSLSWPKRLLYAALITITVEGLFIFIKFGEVIRPWGWDLVLELVFSFTYFVSLFWIYPHISSFIHSEKLHRFRKEVIDLFEGSSVILATLSLTILTKLLPLWIILWVLRTFYDISARFDLEAVRKSLMVNAILGLFFYYFVERERIRKQIRAEQLRYAELQKEEFRVQLQHLEDQVNPGFLFRSLGTLEELIETNEQAASHYVTHLSNLYRSFLNQKEQLVSLKEELDAAKSYYELLKVHFKDSLTITFDISKTGLQLQLPPGSLYQILEKIISSEASESKDLHIEITSEAERLQVIASPLTLQKGDFSASFLKKIEEQYSFLTSEKIRINRLENRMKIDLPLLQTESEGTISS